MSDAEVDYATAPKSLGELRAFKEGDYSKWTPRELLVFALREVDSGNSQIDGAILVYFCKQGRGTMTGMRRANVDLLEALGLLEAVKHDLLTAV